MDALTRFLSYVTHYTTSDPDSASAPSSARQLPFGQMLLEQMRELGLQELQQDAAGNVQGLLPGRGAPDAPALALIAHMDTAPDAPGEGVQPQVVRCTGEDYPLASGAVIRAAECPGWQACRGQDVVLTDGTTLLGADDKAGIAEILTMVELLQADSRPHGPVRVVFTTDEEVGRGVEGLDVEQLGCAWGYTVDGGALGELEYENFNAADAKVLIRGVNIHPGDAKGIMVNALKLAMEFQAALPPQMCPECTSDREGFLHLHRLSGDVSAAHLDYLIRDHDAAAFAEKKALLRQAAEALNAHWGKGTAQVEIIDSYYNMKEKILPHRHLIDRAEAAFLKNGVQPHHIPIRGGTDGAMLSYQGLPCPNLSIGGYQFHSVREFIPVAALETMSQVLADLVCSFAIPFSDQ